MQRGSRKLRQSAALSAFLGSICCARIGYDPLALQPESRADDASGGTAGSSTLSGGSAGVGAGGTDGGQSSAGGAQALAGAGGIAGGLGSAGAASGAAGNGGEAGASASCTATADCTCEAFGGHDYWFCSSLVKQSDAATACAAAAMTLVRIDDDAQNAWLLERALALGLIASNGIKPDLFYTGANDLDQENEWYWQDGTAFWSGDSSGAAVSGAYANWAASNPQTSSTRRCAGMNFSGVWQNRSCTALQPYVCWAP